MKKLITFLIFLSLIPIVTASDDETIFTPVAEIGDDEIYFTQQAGDLELGNFWRYVYRAAVIITGPGGGGQQASFASTPYYDVLITNIRPRYDPGDIVNLTIIIINKGDEPDRDANLTYYLLDPFNTRVGESYEVFEEVPPTCQNSRFDRYQDLCIYENGTVSEPFKTILHRPIALPYNATEGEWRAYVEYETEIQDLIKVFKSFRVGPLDWVSVLILGIAVGGIIIMFIVGDKEDKKENKTIK